MCPAQASVQIHYGAAQGSGSIVAYYQKHGQNLARTVKKLGYPSRATLFNWLKEDISRSTHPCHSRSPVVKFQQAQKEQAVLDLCIRESSAEKIASKHGVSRASLYKWKDELLGRKREPKMSEQFVIQSDDAEQSTENLRSEVARLEEKIAKLQQEAAKYEQEAFRARLQRDIYEKASELIKKEAGIDLDKLTNKEKAIDQCPQRNILFENTAFRNKDSKGQLLLSD